MAELYFPLRLRWADITNLPSRIILFFFDLYYQIFQVFIILFFKPHPPPDAEKPSKKPHGRIAVIGAGLTGVSSAAHCIAHNFDVTLYDKNPSVGGIWSHVNSTSGLQINSLIYRFHPAVFWKEGFPKRDEILGEITRIWQEYQLEPRTKFNSEVVKVERVKGTGPQPGDSNEKKTSRRSRWLVHTAGKDEPDGPFDAVICSIGTCGEPMKLSFDGLDDFTKSGHHIVHSSELDQLSADKGKDEQEDRSDGGDSLEGPDRSQADLADVQPEPGVSYADKAKNEPGSSGEGPDRSVEELTEAQPVPGISYAKVAKIEPGSTLSVNEIASAAETVHHHHEEPKQTKQQQNGDTKKQDVKKRDGSKAIGKQGRLDVHGKTVVIIGSGASGVEAAEWAIEKGADKILLLARDDKWIVPCNVVIDTMLSMQPFGREMPLSTIPEKLIRWFHYRDLAKSVAPQNRPLFQGTPIVNDVILKHIREGLVKYVRCDTERFTSKGVVIKHHEDGSEEEIATDVAILATGFKRPEVDFLPEDLFPKGYERPNLYLQTFSTEDWSVLLTNSAYEGAIGTVGHFHIGIYTRILLTFLLDEKARPRKDDMKLWVDALRFVKRGSPGGALGFFTYMELTIWFLLFHLFRLDRLRWMFFIMQGWGVTD